VIKMSPLSTIFLIYHDGYFLSCEFDSRPWRGLFDTSLCDELCRSLAASRWFYRLIKNNRHGISEILLKVGTFFAPSVFLTYIYMYKVVFMYFVFNSHYFTSIGFCLKARANLAIQLFAIKN
jgi:hypothetical protein